MSIKMTEKDKMLLMILAIIIIIFGAVMLPSVGIKDLITSKNELAESTVEQSSVNKEILTAITDSGIGAAVADKPANAKIALQKAILKQKYAASLIADGICSYCSSYETRIYWVDDICYLYFSVAEDNAFASYEDEYTANDSFELLLTDLATNTTESGEGDLVIGSRHTISLSTDSSLHQLYLTADGAVADNYVSTYAYLLLYLRNLEQKGSIYINSYMMDGAEGTATIEFTILMAGDENSNLRYYGAEVEKCPNCREIYYTADGHECEQTGNN